MHRLAVRIHRSKVIDYFVQFPLFLGKLRKIRITDKRSVDNVDREHGCGFQEFPGLSGRRRARPGIITKNG